MSQVHIFVSYSHLDAQWFDEDKLMPRLIKSLEIIGAEVWFDRHRLRGGDPWKQEIVDAIKRAHIAVLLVSRNFLNSDFIREVELPRIERRFEAGELIVVPILVGHCNWQSVGLLSRPQMVPGKPTPLISYLDSPGEWDRVQEDIFCAVETQVERVREKYNLPRPAARRSAHDIATTVTRLGNWSEHLPPREERPTSERGAPKAAAVPERKPKRWLMPVGVAAVAAIVVAGFVFRGTIFGQAPTSGSAVQAEQPEQAPPAPVPTPSPNPVPLTPVMPAIPVAESSPAPSNAHVPATNLPATTPVPETPTPAGTIAPTPTPVVEREQPVVTAAPPAPSPLPKEAPVMTSDTKSEPKVAQPATPKPKPTPRPSAPKPEPSPAPAPRDPVDALGQTAVDILKQKLDEKLR